jgi:hypothetical protein
VKLQTKALFTIGGTLILTQPISGFSALENDTAGRSIRNGNLKALNPSKGLTIHFSSPFNRNPAVKPRIKGRK